MAHRILVIVLVLGAGCATGEGMSEGELLSQEPVVNLAKEEPGLVQERMDEAAARRALEKARDAFLREDYEACLEVVVATLEQFPPGDIAAELRSIRYQAKREILMRRVAETRVLPKRDVYAFGEDVALELTVRNLSADPLVIPLRYGDSSDSVFVLDVVRQDWDIYGNVRTLQDQVLVPFPDRLTVPVGTKRAVERSLSTGRAEDRHRGFTVFRIGGMMRPSVILCGEERYYAGTDLVPAVVKVMPGGYEPIAEDPAGTFAKAFELDAREHMLLAAELAPPEQRKETLTVLVGYLERANPGMAETIMAALHRLTGLEFAKSRQAWITWWKEEGVHGMD